VWNALCLAHWHERSIRDSSPLGDVTPRRPAGPAGLNSPDVDGDRGSTSLEPSGAAAAAQPHTASLRKVLTTGAVLLKYGRSGRPSYRHIRLNESGYLMWGTRPSELLHDDAVAAAKGAKEQANAHKVKPEAQKAGSKISTKHCFQYVGGQKSVFLFDGDATFVCRHYVIVITFDRVSLAVWIQLA